MTLQIKKLDLEVETKEGPEYTKQTLQCREGEKEKKNRGTTDKITPKTYRAPVECPSPNVTLVFVTAFQTSNDVVTKSRGTESSVPQGKTVIQQKLVKSRWSSGRRFSVGAVLSLECSKHS